MDIFEGLSERQREAVETIDDDLEIIACAGAGKTGVVTRRIVNILKSNPGVLPENIVAFTFTKKAAEELKGRINAYGKSVLGHTKGFAHMYVGTIHGFCIRMLQDYIPEFQKFTVLDEIQTKLFVERYYEECGMQDLKLKKYVETSLFISVMSVLNENWFEQDKWDEKTRIAFEKYRNKMYEEKKFDYSLILREMINQLETNCEFAEVIKNKVKYLTVDEYQDTNPIQEKLIEILKGFGANICVVGDDDQTIYQFRGSDPQNILTFKERYNIKKYIVLDTDYRSPEGIVDVARRIIVNNDRRLLKTMTSGCNTKYDIGDIAYEEYSDMEDEFTSIARRIMKLHEIGIPYSEIAILLRKRKVSGKIAEVLEAYDIPFVVEGVNDLFETKECNAAKGIFDYLNGDIPATELFERWLQIDYPLDKKEVADAMQYLATIDVKEIRLYSEFNIQAIYHEFLRRISLTEDGRNETEVIMYNLGKFSQVIADYEIINYTQKPRTKFNNFCSFLKYTASQYYPEGYMTNSYAKPDAVSIMTVHQSKGLEFAAVFIPQLNRNFFPAQRVGGKGIWHGSKFLSFASLQQYSDYKDKVLYYHFGVYNEEYYLLVKSIEIIESNMKEVRKKIELNQNMVQRINIDVKDTDYSTSLQALEQELKLNKAEYTRYVSGLSECKKRLIKYRNAKEDVLSSIDEILTYSKEIEDDVKSIIKHKCPYCQSEIEDNLDMRIYNYNSIEDALFLKAGLEEELTDIEHKIELEEKKYQKQLEQINDYEKKLTAYNEEISDVLKYKGYMEMRDSLIKEIGELVSTENAYEDELKKEKRRRKKFDDSKKQVNQRYYELMTRDKQRFGLKEISDKKLMDIKSNISAGGSNKPIATIIWYMNLLRIKKEFNPNAILFPIVFDSPNNVETDNEKRIELLKYLFESVDTDTQLIISNLGFDRNQFKEANIEQIIEITNDKYQLLNQKDYDNYKGLFISLMENDI